MSSTPELVQITVPKELAVFMADLSREILAQDNRATASPYFYIIKTKKMVVVPSEYDYDEERFVPRNAEHDYDDEQDARDHEHTEEDIRNGRWIYLKNIEDEDNVFFTQRAYEDHIRRNRHNLRSPYSYVKHAFRNYEIDQLMDFIHSVLKHNPDLLNQTKET